MPNPASDLLPKQKTFVYYYLKHGNASLAARQSGYTKANADVTGPRLLHHPHIVAAIAAVQAIREVELEADLHTYTNDLAAIALFNPGELVQAGTNAMRPLDQLSDQAKKALVIRYRSNPKDPDHKVWIDTVAPRDKLRALTILIKTHTPPKSSPANFASDPDDPFDIDDLPSPSGNSPGNAEPQLGPWQSSGNPPGTAEHRPSGQDLGPRQSRGNPPGNVEPQLGPWQSSGNPPGNAEPQLGPEQSCGNPASLPQPEATTPTFPEIHHPEKHIKKQPPTPHPPQPPSPTPGIGELCRHTMTSPLSSNHHGSPPPQEAQQAPKKIPTNPNISPAPQPAIIPTSSAENQKITPIPPTTPPPTKKSLPQTPTDLTGPLAYAPARLSLPAIPSWSPTLARLAS